MTEQRVTLLEHNGWANQPGRYVDLADGADLEFLVEAATIEAVRIGDWTVDRRGEVSGPPLLVTPTGGAQSFAAEGTYRLSLQWSAS